MTEPTTEKMTAAELNRRIAELFEPAPPSPPTKHFSPRRKWRRNHWNQWEPYRQFLIDANAALELLNELPILNIWPDENGWCIEFWVADSESAATKHKDFCTAICLAWVFWKTGKQVELIKG